MSEVAAPTSRSTPVSSRKTSATTARLQVAIFTAAIFASALLLFSVQPLFAKIVLPKLGGTPAVWAISMCFFQTALLAGYIYAHALNRALTAQNAVLVHVALLILAFSALPIALPSNLSEPPAGDAYLWTLGVLTLGVGLPFFAVSANAPLLQSWFAKTGHASAHDPYFLYAASNIGSLLALLSYPVLIEPLLGLKAQAHLWMLGYMGLAILITLAGVVLLRARAAMPREIATTQTHTNAAPPITTANRATWLALSFLPSGLMVAVTTYISTDLASAPFLWIIPLALFLLTFVLVFRPAMPIAMATLHTAVLFSAVIVMLGETNTQLQMLGLAGALVGFFATSLIAHRELYRRRPPAAHLTEFYIWMSVGGVLGGVFAALLAPRLFTSVLEFKLLLLAAILLRPGIILERSEPLRRNALITIAAAVTVVLALYNLSLQAAPALPHALGAALIAGLIAAALYAVRTWREFPVAVCLVLIIAPALIQIHPGLRKMLFVERSFFGTHRVTLNETGDVRLLIHGTTLHGSERIVGLDGTRVAAPVPATYYHAGGPLARALAVTRSANNNRPVRSAVIGLGTGSMACHAQPGDHMAFYEIDPSVERIARDPQLFTFLARCTPTAPIILGDARLTLAKAPAKSIDYLLIDAFSSNAIPVHLMTREAIELYLARLSDYGVIALHISNRHLNLFPIVAATLKDIPGISHRGVIWTPTTNDRDGSSTFAVLISKSSDTMATIARWPDAFPLDSKSVHGWTDDYSDILPALLRR